MPDVDRDGGLAATPSSRPPFSADRLSSLSDVSKEGSGVASGVEPISYSIWFAKEGVDDGSLASAASPLLDCGVALSHEFGWLL